MLSMIKKILIGLLVVTAVVIIAIVMYSRNRTYFNDESEIGNSAGNIYNGGLYCEQDGKIYFSNSNDDGNLYVMNSDCTKVKKVSSDKAIYINADDNYLYYVRANNTKENPSGSFLSYNNTGVFRIKHNGTELKSISNMPGAYLMLSGNFLYFQKYDVENGLFFYRNKIDASLERELVKDAVIPAGVIDRHLYYVGYSKEHNIHDFDLSSFTDNIIYDGNFAMPIFSGDYIYYLSLDDNYSINRMNIDGTEPTALVKDRCSTYNITNDGKYLIYEVDDGDDSKLCRLNLETMESNLIEDGYYKEINITDDYIFYNELKSNKTHIYPSDGFGKISIFNPPNLSKKKGK